MDYILMSLIDCEDIKAILKALYLEFHCYKSEIVKQAAKC